MEPQPLIDVQAYPDTRGVAIQKVGVKDVEIPISIVQKNGQTQVVFAKVTLSVGLSKQEKGTHLSRFIIQLSERSRDKAFCCSLKGFLEETRKRLDSDSAYMKIDFHYFIDKKSPVTGMVAPMAYLCRFEAALASTYQFALGVEVPIATLCPCSKAISDYGAHNQRAVIRAKVLMDTRNDHQMVWIEDLVERLEECASCPVYPILKREDEKYVTERAYDNPKFVEDVIRECVLAFDEIPAVTGYEVSVEAFESIHGHNAWAYQNQGFASF